MKEQKIAAYLDELGYRLEPQGCIVVKPAAQTVPLAIFEFVTQSAGWRVLCLCEHEIVLLNLSEHTLGLRRGSHRVIAYDDVRAVSVEAADGGMSRRIALALDDEQLQYNAQREETSPYRSSGLVGSWHAENLPGVTKRLQQLGTPAPASTERAQAESCDTPAGQEA